MDIQTRVYKFFADAIGNPGTATSLNILILVWQASLGYISPSITMNWMAIAQDNGIRYLGDIDMQNNFALGNYWIDDINPEDYLYLSGDQEIGTELLETYYHLMVSGDQRV